ncbi:MAG TPA: DUF3383 family protein [Steroidobacteraceae bacterium]|jgi:hypothetical protein|nr:DUF3383 family protein [Steroidobacteraceae bacterium]
MSLDSIVNVIINSTAVNLSRAGFGNMALCACHAFWPERVKRFGSGILTELADLAVPITHPLYLMASAARAQNPATKDFYVLRRTRLPSQVWEFTPATPMAGEVYAMTVDGTLIEVTAGASPTVASIVAALTAALAALADSTATDGTTKTTFTATTPGALHSLTGVTGNIAFADLTTNPTGGGIAQDLTDANNVNSGWYGLQIDSQSKPEILAAAAWVEANKKLFVPASADAACKDPASTTDVMALVDAANYARTAVIYHPSPSHYAGARWMGKQFPKPAGSTNWAHQQLSAEAYALTGAEIAAIEDKSGNFFITNNSLSTTFWGTSGAGEWIDTTHFCDWMRARTQERYFALLVGLEKLPYTQAGLEAAGAELHAQFLEGVAAGGIDGDSPIVIEVPNLADIDPADKAGRNLPGIRGSARLAGAVNTIDPLTITLTLD